MAKVSALQRQPEVIKNFIDLPGCEFTQTTLSIEPGLEQLSWELIGSLLTRIQSGVQWWVGDWMDYGEKAYGEKYAQAVDAYEQTGINVDTLRNYQWVSERVPVIRRLTTLSWSHHQAIAALPPKEQTAWLTKAVTEGLSYRELRREVEKSERKKKFKLVDSVLEKIMGRIEDGCYTAESIAKCSECGNNIFGLELEEIQIYMQQLVGNERAEWRKQGGKTEVGRGEATTLCVPKDMPAGSDYQAYHPHIEYGDERDEDS